MMRKTETPFNRYFSGSLVIRYSDRENILNVHQEIIKHGEVSIIGYFPNFSADYINKNLNENFQQMLFSDYSWDNVDRRYKWYKFSSNKTGIINDYHCFSELIEDLHLKQIVKELKI